MIYLCLFGVGGKYLFEKLCKTCHFSGNDLIPPAPIFEEYRIKREYVMHILENGVERGMPAFKELKEDEKILIAEYLSSLSPKVKIDSSLITRGRYVYEDVCSPCHGIDGRGVKGFVPPTPDFTKFNPTVNMTIEVLNKGIKGSNMYSFRDILSEEDKRAVANYILLLYDE